MKSFILLLKSFIPSQQLTTSNSLPKLYIFLISIVGLKKQTVYSVLLNFICREKVINPNLDNSFIARITSLFPPIVIFLPFIFAIPI